MCPEAITSMTSSSSEDDLRTRIASLARSYIGTPWRHQGRTRTGIDCAGLPIVVGKELGLHEYPDDVNYRRLSTGQDLLAPLEEHCNRISNLAALLPGDIVILRDRLYPQHMGLMSSETHIVHAMYGRKVIEEPLTGDLRAKLIRGYRYRCFSK